MDAAKPRNIAVIVGVSALIVGIALSAVVLLPRQAATSDGYSVVPLGADVGGSGGTVEEERALKSAVFVGRVTEREGEIDIGLEEPFLLPIYAVDVETSLKGEAQGQVRLAVLESESPEELGGHPVVVGVRYLFAAEGPEEGLYWIDEGLGSLRIASDAEAAEVIDFYQRLIVEVEQNPPPPPDTDPCEFLEAKPQIDIEPNKGKAGRNIRVKADRVSNPVVMVYWRNQNHRVGKERVGADCSATIQIKVPGDAKPGRYDIIIVDSRGEEASERFQVTD